MNMELSEKDVRICPACRSVYAPHIEVCPKTHHQTQSMTKFAQRRSDNSLCWAVLLFLLAVFCFASGAMLPGAVLAIVGLSILSAGSIPEVHDKAKAFATQWNEAVGEIVKMLSDSNPEGALEAIRNAEGKGLCGHEFDLLRAKSLYQLGKFEESALTLESIASTHGMTGEITEMLVISYANAAHADAQSIQRLENLIYGLDAAERARLLAGLVQSGRESERCDETHAAVIRLALAEMPDDAGVIRAAAEQAKAEGRLEQAVVHLRKLRMDHHTPESLALWATSLAALNRMDSESEMVYSRYLQSNPSDAVVRVALGNILAREKRHEEAERLYGAGTELDASNGRLWYNLALTRMQAGRYEHAIGALQSFMKTDSLDSYRSKGDVHRIMGMCMMRQGMLGQAMQQFQMADRSVQTLDRLYELAGMFELQGDLRSARACYDEIYAEDITYKDVAKKIRTT